MAITTYTELKSAIADFLNRDDLAAVIPTFISLAEADINRMVRHWRMEKITSFEMSSRYSTLPADFLEVIRLENVSDDARPIELISQGEMQARRYRNLDTSGSPTYYAVTAGKIEAYPTPDNTYAVDLYYYAKTQSLGGDTTTNWLLEYFPDAYLYSALIHSAPYLQEDNRIQTWAALQQNALNSINADSEKSKFGGSGRRMKIRAY